MGTSAPAIKGVSISSLIEDVAKMRDDGTISAALLEQRLTPADRELLDHPVNLAAWYDIHSYRRLAELVCEVAGRREDLLRERGAAAARRLAATGIYQQMESATQLRSEPGQDDDERFKAYGRGLKLIATLSGSILNFGNFQVVVDPEHDDRYCIEVRDSEEIPEVLAYTSEGFINAMSEMGPSGHSGREPAWKLDRRAGRLRYRMTRPV